MIRTEVQSDIPKNKVETLTYEVFDYCNIVRVTRRSGYFVHKLYHHAFPENNFLAPDIYPSFSISEAIRACL